jgi:hypothetical protein
VDWLELVEEVTRSRAQARAEMDRRETNWRQVVADAMRAEGVNRRLVAETAGVTVRRAYQIRDGRR